MLVLEDKEDKEAEHPNTLFLKLRDIVGIVS